MLILSLIRNEARKSLDMRSELAIQRSKNIDVENFENDALAFEAAFGKNYEAAKKYYELPSMTLMLRQKLWRKSKGLTTSGEQLRHANNKTQNLTIKKLTKNNPTMQKGLMNSILTRIRRQ